MNFTAGALPTSTTSLYPACLYESHFCSTKEEGEKDPFKFMSDELLPIPKAHYPQHGTRNLKQVKTF